MSKRILSLMGILLLLLMMVGTVSALEEPDPERTGSIGLTMQYEGQPVAGGTLTLYRVADVHEENGADYSYRLTPEYADSHVSLQFLYDPGVAEALCTYARSQQLPGITQPIDEQGKILFDNLELGLYLLVQNDAAVGYEPVSPFLVSVPGMEEDRYIYHVDGSPKLSLKLAPPTEPPPTEPPPPSIPQTGLTQWPVPVLAVGGFLLILAGGILCTAERKRSHEK